jgi:hypothetical protein
VTEERTAAILLELGRIGVDFSSLPAPLIGTGLRASETLEWLRAIPTGVGTPELYRRLDEHARTYALRPIEIRWRREPARAPYRTPRERWWPTQSLLDAGTDLLIEEWDPFGVRLAGTDREIIANFAFHFFGPFLSPNANIDPTTHVTEMIASAERDHLALNPAPEPHRRYLARRLQELVERYPVPPRDTRYASSNKAVIMVGGSRPAPAPLDPEGVCVRCHGFRTVACVTVSYEKPVSVRYCGPCWLAVRQEFTIRPRKQADTPSAAEQIRALDRMDRPPTSVDSRAWIDRIEQVQDMVAHVNETGTTNEALTALAGFAAGLVAMQDGMDGPMPDEIAAFVRQHSRSA